MEFTCKLLLPNSLNKIQSGLVIVLLLIRWNNRSCIFVVRNKYVKINSFSRIPILSPGLMFVQRRFRWAHFQGGEGGGVAYYRERRIFSWEINFVSENFEFILGKDATSRSFKTYTRILQWWGMVQWWVYTLLARPTPPPSYIDVDGNLHFGFVGHVFGIL